MTSTDHLDDIAAGAREIADALAHLDQLRQAQDARIIAAHASGKTMTELVAADGRSRQMLHRVIRAAE
ncbi:hypothetical protein ACWDTG_06615 [Rhodococcus zopfii]